VEEEAKKKEEVIKMVDEDEEILEEPAEYGFKSKTTEMAKGKVNIKGEKIKEKKSSKKEAIMMKPKKKPSVAKYIPKPITIKRENVSRTIVGIPEGHNGLRPIEVSFRPPGSIFGGKKRLRIL
jgi:hypothetical protein